MLHVSKAVQMGRKKMCKMHQQRGIEANGNMHELKNKKGYQMQMQNSKEKKVNSQHSVRFKGLEVPVFEL